MTLCPHYRTLCRPGEGNQRREPSRGLLLSPHIAEAQAEAHRQAGHRGKIAKRGRKGAGEGKGGGEKGAARS